MKRNFIIIMLILSVNSFAQEREITVYRNSDEVRGMVRIGEVEGYAMKVFGAEHKLRIKAINEAKAEALDQSGDAILIIKDRMMYDPINNVKILAIAYRFPKEGEVVKGSTKASDKEDMYAKLRKLKGLLDDGIISQEEYDKEKAELLDEN